ncbi:NACHT domain-containing NTPase [Actinoplanes sp. DH11]|uniref:NACHT domain-containing protein n=1 Tax=Actinoplanes sp. DH11 TaxID=2857011 RepID=UPI001E5D6BD5|nr:hypothetical protein [Actinoplanes sp. DH11]
MARSPYTLEGAREILSGPDDTWLKALDSLLGVGILATGPFGLAAWGWVDQKNELITLLGKLTSAGRERLGGRHSPERYDVLAATHTALVHGAFFAALREVAGPAVTKIGLTDDEKSRLVEGAQPETARDGIQRALASSRIPLPWAGCGFSVNRDTVVRRFYEDLTLRCVGFFQHFEAWHRVDSVRHTDPLVRDVVDRALRRYEAEYKALAAEVPEFGIWASLGEIEGTRSEARRAGESLSRLEDLMMSLSGRADRPTNRVRDVSAAVNRAVLEDPLFATDATDDLAGLRIPTVQEGYLTPRFRWTVMAEDCRPADDDWWETAHRGNDLDTFLAAYFAAPQSHQRPLVVLGLPGAGKSMFTKVCAARLSGSDAYAVARVPLRQVPDPTAPIHQQVSGVLDKATNGRVSWTELSEASTDATRVLLIDGLDEFMQASGHAESNYLQNVVEFQRVEHIAGHPVSVVVTSRTLVADLARIPVGCLVLKLDNFSPEQVHACLDVWDGANPGQPSRIPPAEAVLSYGEIAQQPLLLLLLVLYGATTGLPAVESDSTPAQIYGGILRRFIKRELRKPAGSDPADADEPQVRAELWRLGVAAFGMFNRGRHYIEEATLLADLDALEQAPRQRTVQRRTGALTAARRVLGKFFFIHAAEVDEGFEGRSYEFLHATFSEYLIASLTLGEIVELWETQNRPSSQNWDDDRLYALLSHQLLDSGGAAILPFVTQLHATLPEPVGRGVREMLRTLLRQSEERWDSGRFAAYSPSAQTPLQRFAAYTANLVMLLLRVDAEPVTLSSIAPAEQEPTTWWRKMVGVWRGCLDISLEQIEPLIEPEPAIQRVTHSGSQPIVHEERLRFNKFEAMVLNAGFGVISNRYFIGSDDREIYFAGYAARALLHQDQAYLISGTATAMLRSNFLEVRPDLRQMLVAHAVRNPEGFSRDDAVTLLSFTHGEPSSQTWTQSLLMAQYPALTSDAYISVHLAADGSAAVKLAPLLAGMLIWDDDRMPVRNIFDRLPEDLRNRIEECGAAVAPLHQSIDRRRLVLLVADLLLPLLEAADLGDITRQLGVIDQV